MKTKLKELRTAAGLTQQQLADRTHVSSRTIISIEKRTIQPLADVGIPAGTGVRRDRGGIVLSCGKQEHGGRCV